MIVRLRDMGWVMAKMKKPSVLRVILGKVTTLLILQPIWKNTIVYLIRMLLCLRGARKGTGVKNTD